MPEFVSILGKQFPKHERLALKNKSNEVIINEFSNDGKPIQPGEDFIYDGPDREAMRIIKEEGGPDATFIGEDFRNNPEFLQSIRSQGFNDVDDYLKKIGFNEKKSVEAGNKLIEKQASHEPPPLHEESLNMGGGQDRSGNKNNDAIGGFGDERVRPASEVRKKRGRPARQQ
jgi:hypothetical protein